MVSFPTYLIVPNAIMMKKYTKRVILHTVAEHRFTNAKLQVLC